jgi:dolichol-phosphate mannosyltransferase
LPNHTTVAMRELAVLVPTRNEAANIEELLRRLSAAVTGITTEIVFVDDSDDDTPDVIREVARRRRGGACRVSLLHRRGGRRSGLGPARALISAACGSAAKLLFPLRPGPVTDPMSGFFLVRWSAVRLDELRPRGFKILLELLVRHPGLRATEIPYTFADRHAGGGA